MEVKFKKLAENAVIPQRSYAGDAGLDLTATRIETEVNNCGQLILVYHTDIAVEIPEGYVGLLCPRSSIYKTALFFSDSIGIIDSGYRGEITAKFRNTTDVIPAVYKVGERCCQLVIVPLPEIEVVEATELSDSERSTNSFGSTGNENTETKQDNNIESEK